MFPESGSCPVNIDVKKLAESSPLCVLADDAVILPVTVVDDDAVVLPVTAVDDDAVVLPVAAAARSFLRRRLRNGSVSARCL